MFCVSICFVYLRPVIAMVDIEIEQRESKQPVDVHNSVMFCLS